MRISEEEARVLLRRYVRGLTPEQADHIMNHLPKLIALIEEREEPCLQEWFLRVG